MTIERNLGPQPIVQVMEQHGLRSRDLVEASTEQITHKMVTRAMKGRRLTENVMAKIVRATSGAAGQEYRRGDLFNYDPSSGA